MALEIELATREEKMADIANEAKSTIEETRRQYRRDLVRVQNTIEVFIDARGRTRGGS
jgi:hypothetical protein